MRKRVKKQCTTDGIAFIVVIYVSVERLTDSVRHCSRTISVKIKGASVTSLPFIPVSLQVTVQVSDYRVLVIIDFSKDPLVTDACRTSLTIILKISCLLLRNFSLVMYSMKMY